MQSRIVGRVIGPVGVTTDFMSAAVGSRAAGAGHRAAPVERRRPINGWAAADRGGVPELDCIRFRLAPAAFNAAEQRAKRVGVGADRVLITAGVLDEEAYVRALGEQLGVAFDPLDRASRTFGRREQERLIDAASTGLLPIHHDDEFALVVAPRARAARRLASILPNNPELAQRFRFTTAERLARFTLQHGREASIARASEALRQLDPMLSASPPRQYKLLLASAILALATIAGAVASPTATICASALSLAVLFMSWLGLRLIFAFVPPSVDVPAEDIPDKALPHYTIMAALYREARSVDGLLRAIEKLDYPAEKLDVILALEADDHETHAALAQRQSRMPITAITVPAGGPRTKPKALNVALPFARGTFTVVYDAEDRPEPDQLRRALSAFRSSNEKLACVQARLCIDNTTDSWLARLFTAEYAGHFDVFLPNLARLHLPLPLGGSSNHFRTAALRAVGGWDSFNVTEDADLGIRLARFGYRTGMIASTTYEEAPTRIATWLPQRTRWLKGWMQTWLVHMREPRRLLRELGCCNFLAFQLTVGGNALSALVHPLFLGGLVVALMTDSPLWTDDTPIETALTAIYATSAVGGYLVSGITGWLGLKRRGLQNSAWALLLMPAHWLLLSLAAWRALYQLVFSPYAWEKTTHGLAKNSRVADNLSRTVTELEHHLRRLKRSIDSTGDTKTRAGT